MTPDKRRKCGQLRIKVRNAQLNLQDSLERMNKRNQEVTVLRKEIENLESQAFDIARSASLNAVGLGDKKGPVFSIGGLAMDGVDGVDGVKLASQIKNKISELSYIIEDQKRYQENSEKYERIIENLRRRIDQIGCN